MPKKSKDESRESRTNIRRGLTRSAIVASTVSAIAKDGEDFSLDEVAAEVGLTKPALYYYFKTREGLLAEVFVAEMQRIAEIVDAAVAKAPDAEAAIEAFVRALFDYHAANEQMSRFVRHRPSAMNLGDEVGISVMERMVAINQLLMQGLVGHIKTECDAGALAVASPRRVAFLTFTSVTGLLAVREVLDDSRYEALMVDLIEMLKRQLVTE